jgi:arylsulfatase A-like enzyme
MCAVLMLVAAALAAPPNLVLVSMDTTRRDALGCYGETLAGLRPSSSATPNLDRLALDGLRMERLFAAAPTTLSSHATMMTGLDPHGHAVARNGFPLGAEHPVLAERLAAEGYQTIAVVGSSALESAMGLNRGFDVYDDRMSRLEGYAYQDRAEGVVDRALEQLRTRRQLASPLFLFVHFYDPHAPYEPPAAFQGMFSDPAHAGLDRSAFKAHVLALEAGNADPADTAHLAGRYLGEVAYVDQQIGRLLRELEGLGLLDRAVVVVTADHGETLSDPAVYAYSHGSDVGSSVMRVPLVARGFGVAMAEHAVVRRTASMAGLAPTLERALGLDATLGDGQSFWRDWRPGPTWDEDGWPERPSRRAFVEATRPRAQEPSDGWNNLLFDRGVWVGLSGVRWGPIFGEAPHAFPASGVMTADTVSLLADLVGWWDQEVPGHQLGYTAPATLRALEELGYLEPPSPAAPATEPAP